MLKVLDVSNGFCPLRIGMIIMGQMLDYCKMLDQAILNNFHREQYNPDSECTAYPITSHFMIQFKTV